MRFPPYIPLQYLFHRSFWAIPRQSISFFELLFHVLKYSAVPEQTVLRTDEQDNFRHLEDLQDFRVPPFEA